MKTTLNLLFSLLIIILPFHLAIAQNPEDALRLSATGLGVGARSLGLGTAYTAVASDFSAMYWNPAGLGQIKLNEASFGLSHISYGDKSTFFGNQQSYTNSSTSLNGFGLVYPFPTSRGSLVFALGYGKQSDFVTGLSFKGFNPISSIIQMWAPNGGKTSKPGGNLAYEMYLANADSLGPNNYSWDSPIKDSLTQSGKMLEGGGLKYVSAAGAVEAAKNLFFGLTLNFITGSYSFNQTHKEQDLSNKYYTQPFNLSELNYHQTFEDDISGFSAKLGILYKSGKQNRIGFTIKTPSWLTIRETYSDDGTSYFDNGVVHTLDPLELKSEYEVETPYVFSGGVSYSINELMLAADLEYTDWTQMQFRSSSNVENPYTTSTLSQADIDWLNDKIKEWFQPTVNIRLGVEYAFSDPDMRVRGGFIYLPSAFSGDPSSFAQKYITAGIGFIVENSVAIDLGYAYGYWDTYHKIYSRTYTDIEKIHTHNVIATVGYRF